MIAAVLLIPGWKDGIQGLVWLFWTAMITTVVIMLTLFCCTHTAKKVPVNYILLMVFTLCESFLLAMICSFYTALSVLFAAGLTVGITLALTAYAFYTKHDYTVFGGALTVISFAIMLLILSQMLFTFPAWWHPFVSAILVIVYGFYLIFDTQLIAGKGQYALSYDDYIIGALIIYIDIVGLFIELLKLFGTIDS